VFSFSLSLDSVAAAQHNLDAEMPRFDFEGVRADARNAWADYLGRIALDPQTAPSVRTNFGPENPTVKAVTLNGKKVESLVLKHAELVKGGELVFTMGK